MSTPSYIGLYKPQLADHSTHAIPSRRNAISILQREFQRIVDAHYAGVWSYVNVLTGGSPDSEDLTHQAFLLAFDRLASNDRTIQDRGKTTQAFVRGQLPIRVEPHAGKVEHEIFDRITALLPFQVRLSDHKPVSCVFTQNAS